MAKHLSKEELESDPLIEHYNQAANYIGNNRTIILSILIGLVVVIGSIIGYSYYSKSQEQKAQELLSTAERYYSEGDYDKALNGDSFELTYGFSQIAENFSGTDAGNLAVYYASVCSFKLGNIEDAISYITNYDVPDGILGVGALSFHANLLAANGSFEKAALMYEKAAKWDVNDSTTPFNLLKAANTYYKAEKIEKAKELASKILNEFPSSAEVGEAQKLLGMLAVK